MGPLSAERPIRTLAGRISGPSTPLGCPGFLPDSAAARVGPGFADKRGAARAPRIQCRIASEAEARTRIVPGARLGGSGESLAVLDPKVQNGFLPAQEIHGSPR
jgi:hypothetical protein